MPSGCAAFMTVRETSTVKQCVPQGETVGCRIRQRWLLLEVARRAGVGAR